MVGVCSQMVLPDQLAIQDDVELHATLYYRMYVPPWTQRH
jgi:hypothetical protein